MKNNGKKTNQAVQNKKVVVESFDFLWVLFWRVKISSTEKHLERNRETFSRKYENFQLTIHACFSIFNGIVFLSSMKKRRRNLRPTEKKWSAVLLVGARSAGPRQTHFIMDLTPLGPCEGERKMRKTR